MEKILGNDKLKAYINHATNSNDVVSSYIINGKKGVGKTLIANHFAKSILCEHSDKPCDECVNCKAFENGNNPDVIYITTTKKSIGVGEIREQVIDTVSVTPYRAKYKVYIIDDADILTIQAQNALLKVLEEPPKYAVFLLCTTVQNSLLPTIISRCNLLEVNGIDNDIIEQELNRIIKKDNLNVEKSYFKYILKVSDNSLGYAKELVRDTAYLALRNKILAVVNNIGSYTVIQTVNFADELAKEKADNDVIYDVLISYYRDLIVYKTTKKVKNCYNIDYETSIYLESDTELSKLYEKIDSINYFRHCYKNNANKTLNLEVLFLKLREK